MWLFKAGLKRRSKDVSWVSKRQASTLFEHVPVMYEQSLKAWMREDVSPATEHYVDGTVGLAGHSIGLLTMRPHARLLCIDRDAQILEQAKKRLEGFHDRVTLVHGSYADLGAHLKNHGFPKKVDGIFLDLGANSVHFDHPERGFSIQHDGPLDMRFDQHNDLLPTAMDIINTASEVQLTQIFKEYGEDPLAKEFAKAIVRFRNRGENSITTTTELKACIRGVSQKWGREKRAATGSRPETRCFQALRIAVNDELNHLHQGLVGALQHLNVNGRLAVLAFHSLEDRPVKNLFRDLVKSKSTRTFEKDTQIMGKFALVHRGAVKATSQEVAENPRARSARLRCIQKIAE